MSNTISLANNMHYTTDGNGPVVILIHGLFGDLDNLKALGKSLAAHFTVIRVDVANHGSSPQVSAMDYPSLAADIKLLIDDLGLESVALVGHSMGGKIAMATALSYPDSVNKLVIADIAPVSYPRRHDAVFNALESLPLHQLNDRRDAIEHMRIHQIDPGTAQFLLKSLKRTATGFEWKMNLAGLKKATMILSVGQASLTLIKAPVC